MGEGVSGHTANRECPSQTHCKRGGGRGEGPNEKRTSVEEHERRWGVWE